MLIVNQDAQLLPVEISLHVFSVLHLTADISQHHIPSLNTQTPIPTCILLTRDQVSSECFLL